MMEKDRLKVSIPHESRALALADLSKGVSLQLDLLNRIGESNETLPAAQPLQWSVIEAGMHSPFEMVLQREDGEDDIRCLMEAAVALESGPVRPRGFTEESLQLLKRSAELGIAYEAEDFGRIALTERTARNVDALAVETGGERLPSIDNPNKEFISLKGVCEALSFHVRKELVVEEPFHGRIRCRYDDSLYPRVREVLPERPSETQSVWVHGYASYGKDGTISQIDLTAIEAIPPDDRLTPIEDLYDIGLTGGLDSVEYVRRIRDGE